MIKSSHNIVESLILKYGIAPVMSACIELQKRERYEECAIIWEVLQEAARQNSFSLPALNHEALIDWMRTEFWREGMSGDIAVAKTHIYAEMCLQEVDSHLFFGIETYAAWGRGDC
jgi:hypothetical protein